MGGSPEENAIMNDVHSNPNSPAYVRKSKRNGGRKQSITRFGNDGVIASPIRIIRYILWVIFGMIHMGVMLGVMLIVPLGMIQPHSRLYSCFFSAFSLSHAHHISSIDLSPDISGNM